ncbi:hypothetical protein B0H14DRAFT_2556556 [Mycena olivaceomarginata]|nr:hypothetical protein B0H14DRAFT_2556556 [Mycena olivaceomarginata]
MRGAGKSPVQKCGEVGAEIGRGTGYGHLVTESALLFYIPAKTKEAHHGKAYKGRQAPQDSDEVRRYPRIDERRTREGTVCSLAARCKNRSTSMGVVNRSRKDSSSRERRRRLERMRGVVAGSGVENRGENPIPSVPKHQRHRVHRCAVLRAEIVVVDQVLVHREQVFEDEIAGGKLFAVWDGNMG